MSTASTTHSYSHACRRRVIGQLYVELGIVTRSQINDALVECSRSHLTLPESLRALGYLA